MTDETRPRARPGIAIQGELFVSPFQPIVLTCVPMHALGRPGLAAPATFPLPNVVPRNVTQGHPCLSIHAQGCSEADTADTDGARFQWY
jgi:hypothetical protein